MHRRNSFQPNALPDAGRAGVENTLGLWLPILLAARHFQIRGVVARLQNNDILTGSIQHAGNIGRETALSAGVFPDKLAVHPQAASVVYRAEVQQYLSVMHRLRQRKAAAIPDSIVKTGVVDAGKLCLARKWDENFPVKDWFVKGKIPFTVQREPNLPLKIRPWVFRSWNLIHGLPSFLLHRHRKRGITFFYCSGNWRNPQVAIVMTDILSREINGFERNTLRTV